jgi:ferric-dicitrate binding protein FerR (iron transport regulator)
VVAGLFFLPTLAFSQQALSHVRAVQLSYVSGTVALKRPGSAEWAKAPVTTPVQEGFELSTSTDSFAEVKFENGSTARLGDLSIVDFSQLALDAKGNKLNHLTFEQGCATFHFMPEQQDAYSVKVADATLTPGGKSEFRMDLREGRIRVEVFNGSVAVVAASGSVRLGKDKVLEFNTGTTEEAFNIRQGIHKDSWDKWVDARDTQAQLALRDQAVSASDPQMRPPPQRGKRPGI